MIEGTLRVNGTSQCLVATLFWEMPFLVDNVLSIEVVVSHCIWKKFA